jgi:drug/metabolite transporter (DMT)-like permease
MLAGAALIIAGAFLLFGGSFTSRRNVLDVGGLTVTAEEQHSVRPWIAGVVLLAGVVLVVVDVRRKA